MTYQCVACRRPVPLDDAVLRCTRTGRAYCLRTGDNFCRLCYTRGMQQHKAFSFRLYPTVAQAEALATMLETHRRLYNAALEHRRTAYKQAKVSVTYAQQSAELPAIRREDPQVAVTSAASCQRTLRRLDKAFQAFFRRLKAGQKPGYPRFKSRQRFNTVEMVAGNGAALRENRLYIQHIGEIKVKLHRPTEGTIKTLNVTRKADGWHVVIVCDLGDVAIEPSTNPPVGIDLGLHAFVATSDGETIPAPQYFRKAQAKLRRAQRHLSRCQRGSNRRRKAVQRVARLHQHVANSRRDFHHKTARGLVDRYGTICAEDLNIGGLNRSMLAKSINDAAWGSFLTILGHKAEGAGVQVVLVDPRNTTQACSGCGVLVPKGLSVRMHRCLDCGLILDRDTNAARNVVHRGLQGPGSGLRAPTAGLPAVAREAVSFD